MLESLEIMLEEKKKKILRTDLGNTNQIIFLSVKTKYRISISVHL